jgi:AcrR family transcriptional regulator
MKQDKQDRRSQRTRHLVYSAMMELLREKRYDAITVQDLLDRADIGRSTFYSHYFDKDDVLAAISEQMLEQFRQQFSQRDTAQGILPSLELFQHVQENFQFFQTMMRGDAEDIIWDRGMTLLSQNIEQALVAACAEKGTPSIPLPVIAQYLAGTFRHLLKWWMEAEMPYTPEEMESIFQQLAMPGVWAALKGKSQ